MSTPDPTTNQSKITVRDFASPIMPTWCPGCGDFAIWTAIKMALSNMQVAPTQAAICFDIGCNGNMADKINAYAFKGLHGRVIPLAVGIHLANKNLPVIAITGDGGLLDEGIHHLIHGIRSNYNITLIVHNNCDFGLTTGQATPTTPKGQKMNSSPYGVVEDHINPTQLALNLRASFVARGFTGEVNYLAQLLQKAIEHEGFSYVEIFQHCPTYNKFKDQAYYKDRIYKVEDEKDYDPTDLWQAYQKCDYEQERIPLGILYQNKEREAFLKRIPHIYNSDALRYQVKKQDVSEILNTFK